MWEQLAFIVVWFCGVLSVWYWSEDRVVATLATVTRGAADARNGSAKKHMGLAIYQGVRRGRV